MQLSPLKAHLHNRHIVMSAICQLCDKGEDETAEHFFISCNKHATSRINLFQQLGPIVDGLGININNIQNSNNVRRLTDIMINGHSELQYQDNMWLFSVAQKYIGNTKRF